MQGGRVIERTAGLPETRRFPFGRAAAFCPDFPDPDTMAFPEYAEHGKIQEGEPDS